VGISLFDQLGLRLGCHDAVGLFRDQRHRSLATHADHLRNRLVRKIIELRMIEGEIMPLPAMCATLQQGAEDLHRLSQHRVPLGDRRPPKAGDMLFSRSPAPIASVKRLSLITAIVVAACAMIAG